MSGGNPNLADPNLADPNLADPNLADPNLADPSPPNPGPAAKLAHVPSENYQRSRDTLVYRLSELTFGSILAGYIFGFISFAATIISFGSGASILLGYQNLGDSFWLAAAQVLIYVFISGTFAYITAAMYTHYHLGILTMPTFAVERSRIDFSIAVSQAGLFGLSMLVPQSFFICVAAAFWVAIIRQELEFRKLVLRFRDAIAPPPQGESIYPGDTWEDARNQLSADVRNTILELTKTSNLKAWQPVNRSHVISIGVLSIVGVYLLLLPALPSQFRGFLAPDAPYWPHIYFWASFVLFCLVLKNAHATLLTGSRFRHRPEGPRYLDADYIKLDVALQTVAKQYRGEK